MGRSPKEENKEGASVDKSALDCGRTRPEDGPQAFRATEAPTYKKTACFFVPGKPVPKGSVTAWKHPKTGAIIRRDQKAEEFASWAGRVAAFARNDGAPHFGGAAVALDVGFFLSRPKGHFTAKGALRPSAPAFPSGKPDVDKLLRAASDALTGVLWDDDSQVVSVTATKRYAGASEAREAGTWFRVSPQ